MVPTKAEVLDETLSIVWGARMVESLVGALVIIGPRGGGVVSLRWPRHITAVTLAVGTLVLAACTVPVEFENVPESRLPPPKPRLKFDARLLTLREQVPGGSGATQIVPVSQALRSVFDPDPAGTASIRYAASNLQMTSRPTTGFYDPHLYRATYALTVTVDAGDQERQVQTVGVGHSGLSAAVAAYAAVDEAIMNLHEQLVTLGTIQGKSR